MNLADYIDHTNLKPHAVASDIEKLCREAQEYAFKAVCVNGAWISFCASLLQGTAVGIAAVVGFPLGAMTSAGKAYEAEQAVRDGANEIDTVLPIGHLIEGNYDQVEDDIRAVVKAVDGSAIVKVIFETGFLNDEQIIAACKLSEAAGAHFVKTSTGFGPGGASVSHVQLMQRTVAGRLQVKASGGIRDMQTALRMIEAGAARLGTSSGVAIMNDLGTIRS